jgi:ubiquinone/menaquinone biosynthesis C-methylase UbiE
MSTILKSHVSWGTAPIRVLDVGCGTGATLEKFDNHAQATGTDISFEALKFCRKRQLPRLTQATTEALPFRENTFDLITCFDVLYHQGIASDVKAISTMVQVLKPGGWLLVREPAYDFLKGGLHDEAVHTSRRYSAYQLKRKLELSGLQIKRITYANTFLLPFAGTKRILERLLHLKNISRADPDLRFSSRGRMMLGILKFEALLIKRMNLPFGLSLIILAQK